MKSLIIVIAFIGLLGLSLATEPIQHSLDVLAGATNTTYNTSIDQIAGSSLINGGDDHEHEYEDD